MSALDNQIEIVRQDNEEIILKTKQHSFILGFVLGFMILWLSVVLSILRGAVPVATANLGVINLTCQRAQSGLINCQRKQSKYFGFKSNLAQEFKSVKGTKLVTKEVGNGETSVFLVGTSGQTRVFGGIGADREKMISISQQLQLFINSSQASITVSHDNRFEFPSLFILTMLSIFPLAGIIFIYNLFCTQTFIFNKQHNLYCDLNHNSAKRTRHAS